MSTTSPELIPDPEPHRAAITGVVKILMARAGIRSRAALALAVRGDISQSVLYSRMAGETDWSAHDMLTLARFFGVPAAVFFAEPTLAGIAPHLGMTTAELGEELAASQNRKKMNASDLQVIDGGDEGGQGRIAHLHLVPTP